MRWRRRLLLLSSVAVAVVALAYVPTTTMRGVNNVVTPHSLPAYVKALDFLDRSANYDRLASEIASKASTDQARMQAVFDWTRTNVRSTPEGFPVVDDHIWHIVVRGYGQDDQKADVFTTLLTYAGVPAYWIFIGPRPEMTLSFMKIDGRWATADVANGVIFTRRDGQLATPDDLAADHRLAAGQGPASYGGVPYAEYFERFHAPLPPDLTRAQMQMFWPRIGFELKRMAGRTVRSWEMRPPSRLTPPA